MAFDELLKERIERIFLKKGIHTTGRKFMGGYSFYLDDKMCVGIDIDKSVNENRLVARIGQTAVNSALKKNVCSEFNLTGKPLKNFVFVNSSGIDSDKDLEDWIQLAIDFNPFAKNSKRK